MKPALVSLTRFALVMVGLAWSTSALASGAEEPSAQSDVGEYLASFFAGLESLERHDASDHIRVAWFGDSAIVGDGYTGELRRRLQDRFGDGGPGFVLASPDFSGYLRKGLRLKRHDWEVASVLKGGRSDGRYGYGGVVSTSYGGASSTFIAQQSRFERVRIYYRETARSGGLQVFVDESPRPTHALKASQTHRGDRVWEVPLNQPAQSVKVRAGGGGLTMLYGVALEQFTPGIVLDALGLVGQRARGWSRADAEHLASQISNRSVSLLVLNFGGNERIDKHLSVAKHQREMTEAITRLRAGAPTASCLVMGPIAHGKGRHAALDPRLETIYEAQRTVADRMGCAFFDTIAAMGGADALRRFKEQRLIGRDMAHLTSKGHRVVGRLLYDWLMAAYSDAATPNETPSHRLSSSN